MIITHRNKGHAFVTVAEYFYRIYVVKEFKKIIDNNSIMNNIIHNIMDIRNKTFINLNILFKISKDVINHYMLKKDKMGGHINEN